MRFRPVISVAAVIALAVGAVAGLRSADTVEAVTGGLHTTDVQCNGVNLNHYDNKLDVYLEGGPGKTGASALTPGNYGVEVTAPGGTLLGKSDGATITVASDGTLPCTQLWTLVEKASDGSQGYDDTTNNGGEYKVTICLNNDFAARNCKSDNFKVEKKEAPPFNACTPYANRTIVTFGGVTLGDPNHPPAGSLVAFSTAIPVGPIAPGAYNVTLQSSDAHSGHGGQSQFMEQWFAVFGNGGGAVSTSGTIDDLPEAQDVINQVVGQVTFNEQVTNVVAFHKLWDGTFTTPESIAPVCLALDPVR